MLENIGYLLQKAKQVPFYNRCFINLSLPLANSFKNLIFSEVNSANITQNKLEEFDS